MKRQLIKMTYFGVYRVIYDDCRKYNKYVVTLNNKKVIDYANFKSCLLWLSSQVPDNE